MRLSIVVSICLLWPNSAFELEENMHTSLSFDVLEIPEDSCVSRIPGNTTCETLPRSACEVNADCEWIVNLRHKGIQPRAAAAPLTDEVACVHVGVVADQEMVDKLGSIDAARDYFDELLKRVSPAFEKDFNTKLSMKEFWTYNDWHGRCKAIYNPKANYSGACSARVAGDGNMTPGKCEGPLAGEDIPEDDAATACVFQDANSTRARLHQLKTMFTDNVGDFKAQQGTVNLVMHAYGRGGGGLAYGNGLYSFTSNFAVTGSMKGDFGFWDHFVVAHELGHNFGAPHTHAASVSIDECATCSSEVFPDTPALCQKDSYEWNVEHDVVTTHPNCGTIMSYCHGCRGGLKNVIADFHPEMVAYVTSRTKYYDINYDIDVPCDAEDGETCDDGIQNQDETGIDCGGACGPCETCDDGIQNQDETGIDCGGACGPCETCDDGIQNQDEIGIDCGGPCGACVEWTGCEGGWLDDTPEYDPEHAKLTLLGQTKDAARCIEWASGVVSVNDGIGGQHGESRPLCDWVLMKKTTGTSESPCICYQTTGDELPVVSSGFSSEYKSCRTSPYPSCEDGIQNGDETGIDCGGGCGACQGECQKACCRDSGECFDTNIGITSGWCDVWGSVDHYVNSGGAYTWQCPQPSDGTCDIQLALTGTAGNYYGTQYDENQTPTIQDCARLCALDDKCGGITYGTQNGEAVTAFTKTAPDGTVQISDGVRANDCILVKNLQPSGRANKRWNVYSVDCGGDLSGEVKFAIGDRVRVRDEEPEDWQVGTVAQVGPVRVTLDKTWIEIRHMDEDTTAQTRRGLSVIERLRLEVNRAETRSNPQQTRAFKFIESL